METAVIRAESTNWVIVNSAASKFHGGDYLISLGEEDNFKDHVAWLLKPLENGGFLLMKWLFKAPRVLVIT